MPRLSNGSESPIEPQHRDLCQEHRGTDGKAPMSPFVTHTGTKRELRREERALHWKAQQNMKYH